MIFPSMHELTQNRCNRYELVIAVAKCARKITEAELAEREAADTFVVRDYPDKNRAAEKNEKAVITAINKIYYGEYSLHTPRSKA